MGIYVILFSKENEWATDKYNDSNVSHGQNEEWKKPDTKKGVNYQIWCIYSESISKEMDRTKQC